MFKTFVIWYIPIIISCVIAIFNDTIKCESQTECNIDCTSQDCNYHVIDGTFASSLIVNCSFPWSQTGNDGCRAMQVICPSYGSSCAISCDGRDACYQTMIQTQYVSSSSNDDLSLSCSGEQTCGLMTIYVTDWLQSLNVSLSQYAPIYPTTLTHAHKQDMRMQYFRLNCTEKGCNELVLDLESISIANADISCNAFGNCASVAWSFTITSLMNIQLNAPYNHAKITANLLYDANLYLECIQCDTLTFVVMSSTNIQRQNNNNTAYINCKDCGSSILDTGFYFHDVKVVMECAENGCIGTNINAGNAQSLELICNEASSCWRNAILCPYHAKDVCNIKCGDREQSCHEMEIYASNQYVVDYMRWFCPKNMMNDTCKMDFYCLGNEVNKLKLRTNLTFDGDSKEYKCSERTNEYCCPNTKEVAHEEDLTWFIVGISFICLFAVLLCIALDLFYHVNKQTAEYQKVQNERPEAPDTQIETETLKENEH